MRRRILLLAPFVLALFGCGSSGGALSGYGVRLLVPAGWHERIWRGAIAVTTRPISRATRGPDSTTRHLGPNAVSVLLFEDTRDSAWSPPLEPRTYRTGPPRPFTASELADPNGARRNFTVAGRYFDLFVSTRSGKAKPARLRQLNTIVRSLRVRPGDFYRGRVAPARFRPARGWLVRRRRALPAGTNDFSVTIAATVAWRDALNNDVPSRSLARLRGSDGIAVLIRLEADNRFPPAPRSTRMRLGRLGPLLVGAGPTIPGVRAQSGSRDVGHEYSVGITVIYGSTRPTRGQQARARAELARLVLPRWPRWP